MGLYRKLKGKPALFLSTTGTQLDRFEQLTPEFERAYLEFEARRKSRVVKTGEDRQRQPGGGAQFSTALQERLLMPFALLPALSHTRVHDALIRRRRQASRSSWRKSFAG